MNCSVKYNLSWPKNPRSTGVPTKFFFSDVVCTALPLHNASKFISLGTDFWEGTTKFVWKGSEGSILFPDEQPRPLQDQYNITRNWKKRYASFCVWKVVFYGFCSWLFFSLITWGVGKLFTFLKRGTRMLLGYYLPMIKML